MTLNINLEQASYAVAILTAIIITIRFLIGHRRKSIDSLRDSLAQTWTNEGDVSGTERRFITLEMNMITGDLVGSLYSPRLERPLEAHIYPGWFSARLEISELLGRNLLPIATVNLKLKGNKNRLKWCVKKGKPSVFFPEKTLLWISTVI